VSRKLWKTVETKAGKNRVAKTKKKKKKRKRERKKKRRNRKRRKKEETKKFVSQRFHKSSDRKQVRGCQ